MAMFNSRLAPCVITGIIVKLRGGGGDEVLVRLDAPGALGYVENGDAPSRTAVPRGAAQGDGHGPSCRIAISPLWGSERHP